MKFNIFTGKYNAAIFDLDGTLINSMWVWENILSDFIETKKITTDGQLVNKVSYMNISQSSALIAESFPELNMTAKEIRSFLVSTALDFYTNEIKLKRGAKNFLVKLKSHGIKLSLVTSCPEELASACLKSNGIYDMIDHFAYAEKLGLNKSNPQIFTKTLAALNSAPETAVLFEDIKTALVTAKKLNLKTVIVEDLSSAPDKEYLMKNADLYIKDFTDL